MHHKKFKNIAPNWNFGPNISSCKSVKYISNYFAKNLKLRIVNQNKKINFKPETSILRLSNYKAKKFIKWYPRWSLNHSLKKILDWNLNLKRFKTIKICEQQIKEFLNS